MRFVVKEKEDKTITAVISLVQEDRSIKVVATTPDGGYSQILFQLTNGIIKLFGLSETAAARLGIRLDDRDRICVYKK